MSQKFNCEHCNSKVEVAQVCAKCGRDHSEEWMNKNSQIESQSALAGAPAMCYIVYKFVSLAFSDVPFKQWPMIDIFAIAIGIAFVTALIMLVFGGFRIKTIEERQVEKQAVANIRELIKQANKKVDKS